MRKTMMLALAAAAVTAFAVPAVASAGWLHSGVELKKGEHGTLSAVGSAKFEGELGGAECETIGQATFEGGTTTGKITQFEPNGTATAKCKSLGLLPVFGCTKVEAVANTGLPWTAHRVNGASKVQVTTGIIHLTLLKNDGQHCVIPQITLNPGNVTIDVAAGEQQSISKFTLSGELETSEGEAVEVSGSQTVTPAGTYGMTP